MHNRCNFEKFNRIDHNQIIIVFICSGVLFNFVDFFLYSHICYIDVSFLLFFFVELVHVKHFIVEKR
jgi:hypothetical protein